MESVRRSRASARLEHVRLREESRARVEHGALGELIAKRPRDGQELPGAVLLGEHRIRVRIVDNVARTEVEEVFENETDEVLEGIYRFPLPPGAQIERLALEVDGKLDGGRVRRSRAGGGDLARRRGQRGRQEARRRARTSSGCRDPGAIRRCSSGSAAAASSCASSRSRRAARAASCSRTPRSCRRARVERTYVYPLPARSARQHAHRALQRRGSRCAGSSVARGRRGARLSAGDAERRPGGGSARLRRERLRPER